MGGGDFFFGGGRLLGGEGLPLNWDMRILRAIEAADSSSSCSPIAPKPSSGGSGGDISLFEAWLSAVTMSDSSFRALGVGSVS